jgi:hypothetical protein
MLIFKNKKIKIKGRQFWILVGGEGRWVGSVIFKKRGASGVWIYAAWTRKC